MTAPTDSWYSYNYIDSYGNDISVEGVSVLLRLMAMAPAEEIKGLAKSFADDDGLDEPVRVRHIMRARREWAMALIEEANK